MVVPRTKTYGRTRRISGTFHWNTPETHWKMEAVFRPKLSRMISDRFPQKSTGNSQEFIGKKFRPEYCFHFRCFPAGYGDFSAPFLQDPAGYGGRNLRPGYSLQVNFETEGSKFRNHI
jgi:hypothetical protein